MHKSSSHTITTFTVQGQKLWRCPGAKALLLRGGCACQALLLPVCMHSHTWILQSHEPICLL